jgi:hypothetical protein
MQPSRGIPLAARVALHTILAGLFLGITPHASYAQAPSTLPKSWNDAVAKLGDEVAAAVSPAAVALKVNNISSLDALYAGAVEAAVRGQLQRHSFSFAPENTAAAQSAIRLQLSLSESAGEYVWVMQVLSDQSDTASSPVIIVAASKADSADAGADEQSLSLEKRFVWKQPERVLDFALLKDATSGELSLLVLGTNRLSIYKPTGSQWQLSRTSPMPQATPPSRDPQGTINLKEGTISLNGFECFGDSDLAGVLRCRGLKPSHNLAGAQMKIPGFLSSLSTTLAEKCLGEFVFLFTAESDWTQSDSIQGRLTKGIPLPLVPAGNTLEFDGPVIALQSESVGSSARAVVRNLKTDEYEAYIVTATCGN